MIRHAFLLTALLAVPAVAAEPLALRADAVVVEGGVSGALIQMIEVSASKAQEPWAPGLMQLSASSARVEAWFEDSGGTAIAVNPMTEPRVVYEGSISHWTDEPRPNMLLIGFNASGVPAQWPDALNLAAHNETERPWPDLVAPTGKEETILLDSTTQAELVGERAHLHIEGSFTLVMWNWNATFAGDSGEVEIWSGERPHGPTVAGRSPQGFDAQLLILHVTSGKLSIPLEEEYLRGLFLTPAPLSVSGSALILGAWDPTGEAARAAETRRVEGDFVIAAQSLEGELSVEVELPEPPPIPAAAAGNTTKAGGAGELQSATIAPAWSPSQWQLVSAVLALIALAALLGWLAWRRWAWQRVQAWYADGAYQRVARRAARFHGSSLVGADAQTMTMVAAFMTGQYHVVAVHMSDMDRIREPIRSLLRAYALAALGRRTEADAVLALVPPGLAQEELWYLGAADSDVSRAYQ